ncbi:MAG TPA: hypothetical protein VFL79_13995 [Terriglobia bacterium]|nr:hypothetical protein [Terriglobia bacterium]
MSKTLWQTMLVLLALFILLPAAAPAQQEKPSGPLPSNLQNSKDTRTPGKLPLQSVTMVNTREAARKVAEEESAKVQGSHAVSETARHKGDKSTANPAVLEFHPTAGTSADASKETFQVKNHRKKSALKNIHGSAYGAAASGIGGGNVEGGDVGADSRGGKFNVYVEGEHAHDNTPGSH